MCAKIDIKEDLSYKAICNQCNYSDKESNSQIYKYPLNNQHDLQKKLTGYLVRRLRTSSNRMIGSVLKTTSKF